MKQTIMGNPPAKSNCYRIGHRHLYKTEGLKDYEKLFDIQCNYYRNKNIEGYFEFYIDVFYPSRKSDLDNSLKCILDCLQDVKAIKNDNKCVKIVAQRFLDKEKPRIEFTIIEIL